MVYRYFLRDVFEGINNKLIERHPPIFYDKDDSRWREGNWEESKQKEKNDHETIEQTHFFPIFLEFLTF